jgi:hypothetical protein
MLPEKYTPNQHNYWYCRRVSGCTRRRSDRRVYGLVNKSESDAGRKQICYSVLLGLVMAPVYLYCTIISKEDKLVFWFVAGDGAWV